MKLDAGQKKALKALCGKRSPAELKRLFALVRTHDDRALLAALRKPKKRVAPKSTLARELSVMMRPLLAPAAEKAELLVEHLNRLHKRKLSLEPKGLADAVKLLRAHYSEAQIRSGAAALMKELARLYAARETVV